MMMMIIVIAMVNVKKMITIYSSIFFLVSLPKLFLKFTN